MENLEANSESTRPKTHDADGDRAGKTGEHPPKPKDGPNQPATDTSSDSQTHNPGENGTHHPDPPRK